MSNCSPSHLFLKKNVSETVTRDSIVMIFFTCMSSRKKESYALFLLDKQNISKVTEKLKEICTEKKNMHADFV